MKLLVILFLIKLYAWKNIFNLPTLPRQASSPNHFYSFSTAISMLLQGFLVVVLCWSSNAADTMAWLPKD